MPNSRQPFQFLILARVLHQVTELLEMVVTQQPLKADMGQLDAVWTKACTYASSSWQYGLCLLVH